MSSDTSDRIVTSQAMNDDGRDVGLRPQGLAEFVGQRAEKENLRI
ncbi:MAG: Holliday junction branch migration DNA helicase RuvB, partial [Rhodospirillaceae bacterium]|nr:Holliday junction branch migration DNA helicase RuvB [Rhodospirillaceae bacterium]